MTLSLLVHVGHPILLKTFYSWSESASIFVNSTIIKVLFIGAQAIKASISLLESDGTITKVLLQHFPLVRWHVLSSILLFELLVIRLECKWILNLLALAVAH
jgi:hypothetical protein